VKWIRLLLVVVLLGGCTANKPPLPKFAVSEAPRPVPPVDAWSTKLRETDIVYFGLTKKSIVDDKPASHIVESFQANGARVALGWAELSITQQPLLDQWQRQEISGPELVDQLGPPARREWFQRALRPDLIQRALGSPPDLLRKIRAGEKLQAEERALLPNDYRANPDDFDNFSDRVATSARLRRYDITHLYRAHLAAEQMIAENIVRFTRETPEVKLLVFLPDDVMTSPREVANYVAQKTSARQMILDRSERLRETHSQLLTDL
jgi:hypothetical protein